MEGWDNGGSSCNENVRDGQLIAAVDLIYYTAQSASEISIQFVR